MMPISGTTQTIEISPTTIGIQRGALPIIGHLPCAG